MGEKVVRKWKLGDPAAERVDLEFWLSLSPEERLPDRREALGPPRRSATSPISRPSGKAEGKAREDSQDAN